ncbi:hypothetical protein Hypma_016251 [Hypsizygus marmoreus]|uniref:F-box domain-containing protein n=1 Tax=Hypsizygus marmoreus TaxID=39966 RepID=A0A369IY77_HYPMA|nr:hypothetical protein Hypma_016251 [Hypsizygus marmoreus]
MASLIPLDILDSILDRTSNADLASFCRTSKSLYPHAKNALFRHLHLNGRNVLKACFALGKDPELAARVNSFILVSNTDVSLALGTIQYTLSLVPQLRTLILRIGTHGSWILPQDNTSPFQLKTFRCGFGPQKEVFNFLVGQPGLRYLSLNYLDHDIPSPTLEVLPQLVAIAAPLSAVQKFVPGRPIRDVTIYEDNTECNKDILECLTHSTAKMGVQRLLSTPEHLFYVGGKRLASLCPNLTHLTSHALNLNPNNDAEVLLPNWMEDVLSHQRSLHFFKIVFDPRMSSARCKDIDFSDFVTLAFEASASLQYIIVAFLHLQARYTCKRIPGQDWFLCDDFEAF